MGGVANGVLSVELRQDQPIPLDVAFACRAGELLGLIGPSGSGKTTILRAIAGLDTPDMSRIVLGDTVWADTERKTVLSPQARRCGLVFQDYALFPHMNVLANISAPLLALGPGERTRRARELLVQVNLEGLEARRPDQLSGGQLQRVAVARALARDPAVLLLDEPFSAVDQATRKRLQRELSILRNSLAIPALLVTHDLREAMSLADRISVVDHGRILQSGAPDEIISAPASPRAARLLGLSNIFEGRVGASEHGSTCTWIDWQGQRLEARTNNQFQSGDSIRWVIPESAIVLHRRNRPSRGERENPITGQVAETVVFGDETEVVLRPTHAPELPLAFKVSTHAAIRNDIRPGVQATVSLLADAIHLMAGEE